MYKLSAQAAPGLLSISLGSSQPTRKQSLLTLAMHMLARLRHPIFNATYALQFQIIMQLWQVNAPVNLLRSPLLSVGRVMSDWQAGVVDTCPAAAVSAEILLR